MLDMMEGMRGERGFGRCNKEEGAELQRASRLGRIVMMEEV